MKDQLQTIRHNLEPLANNSGVRKALAALSELERMAVEPVAWMYDWLPTGGPTAYDWISSSKAEVFAPENCYFNIRPLYAAPPAQQPQARKPLFTDLIAQHPGLREELLEMDKQTQAEVVHFTRADLDRAYSAGLVEGERLAIQQAEAVPNPAVAAIKYVLEHPTDSPVEFLNCWMYGDFSALRNEWEDVPEAVFVGADPAISTAPQQAEAVPSDPIASDCIQSDAARYRWLRTNAIGAFITGSGEGPVSVYLLSQPPAAPGIQEETDAAIYAAMAQGAKT